ncbi:MAG TPA: sulfotransferase family protein [Paracoccaceae bacterium]|nr:sulfotransferase family protein [Paracoccaceae bacterium]
MGFPGTWMTQSGSVIYRVVPKCACSTIGQIMYFADSGEFFDGDIHDAQQGLHKWGIEDSRAPIENAVLSGHTYAFTCVRNPYTRILSAFFDKIAGIQRNGNRYRGNLVPMLARKYGIEVEGDFDQIAMFRRFVLFARDTIRFKTPMDPDIHWSAMSGHIATFVANGGRFDKIITTENFTPEMQDVLSNFEVAHPLDVATIPRFNESADHGPKRAFPVAEYFDDLTRHLVYEIYHRDFELFKYSTDPAIKNPIAEIDVDEVHKKLGGD